MHCSKVSCSDGVVSIVATAAKLLTLGISFKQEKNVEELAFSGLNFVITGTFEGYSRSEIKEKIITIS